ncbi:hypothetical protein EON63_13770 [archaeon]|nr:MAG: hypothetical protein EON63_13770 [archaeon]
MFSKVEKKKEVELGKYTAVHDESSHGKLFTIEDDDVEASISPAEPALDPVTLSHQPVDLSRSLTLSSLWSTLTFTWLQDLLTLGNRKPLTLEDLYPLPQKDQSAEIYTGFKQAWQEQLRQSASPSLAWSFASSYGRPFLAAGLLKLVHDSCLFLGPLLLNSIISFLSHPEQPLSAGLFCVGGLFFSNLLMSLCLRQYFFTCYRVGMNLRSAVVTSIYHKSLVLNTSVLSRKTTGEISNLMSVDSSRLQELTPYLHALWYSFFQIILALVFLYRQLGLACLAGECGV